MSLYLFFKVFKKDYLIVLIKNRAILISILLSILVLYSTLRVSFTYLYYNIDPIGFVEALCENKDQPELACNGKCHLKKVISTSQNSEKAPIQLIELKDLLLYNSLQATYSFQLIKGNHKLLHNYLNNYQYLDISSCFHPPQASFL